MYSVVKIVGYKSFLKWLDNFSQNFPILIVIKVELPILEQTHVFDAKWSRLRHKKWA